MADESDIPLQEEDEADLEIAQAEAEIRARVEKILASLNGKSTEITAAGRENMRTVNRLAKVIALRHVKTDKTFRHNISRYHTDALDQDILIGARREGSGVWTLVAELVPRQ